MNRLIANGNGRLYKFGGHLMRTPFTTRVSLLPDAMAAYDVGMNYMQSIPTRDVFDAAHYLNVPTVGKLMRKYYLAQATRPGTQLFRNNGIFSRGFDPGFIFYQGLYSPSWSGANAAAYMTIPAYHFSVPQKYEDFDVERVDLSCTHGGTVFQWGSPKSVQSSSSRLPYFAASAPAKFHVNEWGSGGWDMKVGCFSSVDGAEPRLLFDSAQSVVTFDTARVSGSLNLGTANAKSYWYEHDNGIVSVSDGTIPVTSAPWVQTASLSDAFVSAADALRDFWVVPIPPVSTSASSTSTSSDYPYWEPGSDSSLAGYWLCCSFWGFKLDAYMTLN